MELKGKNVIYSGGFGGIGQACIQEILNRGAKYVTIFDLAENKAVMDEFKKSCPGAKIDFIPLDMRKKETITAAFKSAVEKMGHFDVLVNSCGIMRDSEVDLTIAINLLGVIHSNLAALPYMDKSSGGRGGVIVNISSVACLEPPPLYPIYSASKDGVKAFTRCMADQMYYERFGISFITICPGITDTPMSEGFYTRVYFKFVEEKAKALAKVKLQPVDVLAKNMIKVMETGKNGGVYMLNLGKIEEITFPKLWEPIF